MNGTERKTVTLAITVTPEERKAMKQLALDRDTSMSDLVRGWLREAVNAPCETTAGKCDEENGIYGA